MHSPPLSPSLEEGNALAVALDELRLLRQEAAESNLALQQQKLANSELKLSSQKREQQLAGELETSRLRISHLEKRIEESQKSRSVAISDVQQLKSDGANLADQANRAKKEFEVAIAAKDGQIEMMQRQMNEWMSNGQGEREGLQHKMDAERKEHLAECRGYEERLTVAESKIEQLNKEREGFISEIAVLKTVKEQAEGTERGREEALRQLSAALAMNQHLEAEMNNMQATMREWEKRSQQLQDNCEAAVTSSLEREKHDNEQIQLLQNELAQIRAKVEEEERRARNTADSRRSMSAQTDVDGHSLLTEMRKLEREIEKLHEENERMNVQYQQVSDRLQEVDILRRNALAQAEQQSKTAEEYIARCTAAESRILEAEARTVAAQKRILDAEEEVARLRDQSFMMVQEGGKRDIELLKAQDQLRDAAETMASSDSVLQHWQQRANALNEQCVGYRRQLIELNANHETELMMAKDSSLRMKAEMDRLASQLAMAQSAVSARENEWNAKRIVLESQISRLETEKNQIHSELARAVQGEKKANAATFSLTHACKEAETALSEVVSRLKTSEAKEAALHNRIDSLLVELGEASVELQRAEEHAAKQNVESHRAIQGVRDELARTKEESGVVLQVASSAIAVLKEIGVRCQGVLSGNGNNNNNSSNFQEAATASPGAFAFTSPARFSSTSDISSNNNNNLDFETGLNISFLKGLFSSSSSAAPPATALFSSSLQTSSSASSSLAASFRHTAEICLRLFELVLTTLMKMRGDNIDLSSSLAKVEQQNSSLRNNLETKEKKILALEEQVSTLVKDVEVAKKHQQETADAFNRVRQKNELLLQELEGGSGSGRGVGISSPRRTLPSSQPVVTSPPQVARTERKTRDQEELFA